MNKIKTKRSYTVGEEIFSAITHGVGAALSVVALVLMLIKTIADGNAVSVFSAAVFGVSLIILYMMSTLYHALTPKTAKKVFRIFDHATIFLLIAGTYTPYVLLALSGNVRILLFCILWVLAAVGITFDSIMLDKFRKIEMLLYVGMGWCILFASENLLANLAPRGTLLLFTGGVLYTVGIIFYALKKIPYMHPIWHLFVLGGSIFHFFSVYLYVL